jgi:hypothetical protein
MRGIPSGVGNGAGSQNSPVLASTWTRLSEDEMEEAVAIAVSIRCATTQPMIFSREGNVDEGESRKR